MPVCVQHIHTLIQDCPTLQLLGHQSWDVCREVLSEHLDDPSQVAVLILLEDLNIGCIHSLSMRDGIVELI